MGQAGILRAEVDGREEPALGYLIHRPYWRRGYATEAAAAGLDYAFAKLDVPRVISLIRPENVPSLGVVRKLGMVEEGRTMYAGFDHLVWTISRGER